MTKRSIEMKTNELRTYHAFNHLIKMLLIQDQFLYESKQIKNMGLLPNFEKISKYGRNIYE